MAAKGVTSILAGYFNTGEGKKPIREFNEEMKALTEGEKVELALGVCGVTGDTIAEKK